MRVVTLLVSLWVAGCVVSTDDGLWKLRDASGGSDTATKDTLKALDADVDAGPTDSPQPNDGTDDGPGNQLDLPLLDTQKHPNGSACSQSHECASGHCVDLFCCDASCGGLCEACDVPGKEGACSLIKTGADPDDECAKQAASSCGKDGFCDGKGGCRLYASSTRCGSPVCVNNSTRPKRCDGNGQCINGPQTSCLPFKCNQNTGACFTSCSSDAQCVAYRCGWFTKKCRSSCSQSWQCQSGFSCKNGKCVK